MPLLYGEGSKAFARLQHEIIRFSSDESIFAWTNPSPRLFSGMFAGSPADFSSSGDICPMDFTSLGERSYSMTNLGLTIKLQCEAPADYYSSSPDITMSMNYWTAPLACGRGPSDLQRAPVILTLKRKEGSIFRVDFQRLELFSKMIRPRSPHFFTKTLHVSEVDGASRFNINNVFLDQSSDEHLRRLSLLLTSRVWQEFRITQRPKGFYEVPYSSGSLQSLSDRPNTASRVSFEMSHHDSQVLRLVFHRARNSTARLEVCWIKKEDSVYNGWLDFLGAPSTIIHPNNSAVISAPGESTQGVSSVTVSLRHSVIPVLSDERIWLIEIS